MIPISHKSVTVSTNRWLRFVGETGDIMSKSERTYLMLSFSGVPASTPTIKKCEEYFDMIGGRSMLERVQPRARSRWLVSVAGRL